MDIIKKLYTKVKPALCLHRWNGAGWAVVKESVSALRYCPKCDKYERLTSSGPLNWVPCDKKFIPRNPLDIAKQLLAFMQETQQDKPVGMLLVNTLMVPELQMSDWFNELRAKLLDVASEDINYRYSFEVFFGALERKPQRMIHITRIER